MIIDDNNSFQNENYRTKTIKRILIEFYFILLNANYRI